MPTLRKSDKLIILYSGGLDSTTALYKYAENIELALTFNYGSKHNAQEIKFAKKNRKKLNIKHKIINLDFNKLGFTSNLLKKGDLIPDGHYEDISMKKTGISFRNGILLSIAAGIAESIGYDKILISNHYGDHTIYPDCRENFIKNMNAAIKTGTYKKVEILAPFTNITKRDIALIGKKINIDYSLTYSCYKGNEIHCGTCGTCIERKEALQEFDKTKYLC